MNTKLILKIIKQLSKINEGTSGHCGNFAIALNRILKNQGIYMVLYDPDMFEDGYHHVVLKVGDLLFDAKGLQTKESIYEKYGDSINDKESDVFDKNDYRESRSSNYFKFEEESDERLILNKTDCGDESTVNEIIEQYNSLIS